MSKDGVSMDSTKVIAIIDWPRPISVTEVRSFLGLAGYYRQFVEGFCCIALPFINLTRKEVKFEWNDDCECSFQEFKQRLISAPILALSTDGGGFVIYSDVS